MINLYNLSSYDMPKAIEERNKDFVSYGEDNNYYEYLIEQFLQSPTNNAAIRSISDLIFGQGLTIKDQELHSQGTKELHKIIKPQDLRKIITERKMLGQAAMQIIYTKAGNNRKVKNIKHFPIHTLRPAKMASSGLIEEYFYHSDWKNYQRNDVLKSIPAFGTSTEKIEMYIIRPYVSGYTYFSPPCYSGAIPYCEIEREIADYLINEVKNSFSGTKLINFNNGIPSKEERALISQDVKNKLTGAKGQKVIVAFNKGEVNKTTVEDISLDDAPAHYEYLANEARDKILVGHRVTSPMLLGIKDTSNGLGNNADEIKTASQLFNSSVIESYQREFLESLEEILEVNGQAPEMEFITAQPIEFTDEHQEETEDEIKRKNERQESNNGQGVNNDNNSSKRSEFNKHTKLHTSLSEDELKKKDESQRITASADKQLEVLMYLSNKGETAEDLEGYELIDSVIDDNEHEEADYEAAIREELGKDMNFAYAPSDTRAKDSIQDTDFIKVRYVYKQKSKKHGKSQKHRPFCSAMEGASRFYRKEDILKMKDDGVNSELGHKRQAYSLWLHKGGVNCYHGWERQVYMKKTKKDGSAWGGNAMNGVRKVSVAVAKKLSNFDPKRGKWKNDKRVAEAQIDRADKGHHPNYKGRTKKKK